MNTFFNKMKRDDASQKMSTERIFFVLQTFIFFAYEFNKANSLDIVRSRYYSLQ